MDFNTRVLHGRSTENYAFNATLPPIAQVTAFGYKSAEEQEKVFHHKAFGFAYTRIGNPTVSAFENRIAELEGAPSAVATSSGMSAVVMSMLNVLQSGDEIVAAAGLYGGTLDLFKDLEKFGIHTHFAKRLTPEYIEPLLNEHTRIVFGEVISNPGLFVLDIPKLSEYVHGKGLPLIVDATTATPYLISPLSLGADIVVHSSSKYINGGGNSISGIIVDGAKFNWDPERYPAMKDFEKYGRMAYSIRLRTDTWENFGTCVSPFNAYMNIVGLETLGLRMERICYNARQLARSLSEIDGIYDVNHPTLETSEAHELAETELHGYGGGILTLRAGSREKAFHILNHLKYCTIASNIGDIRTLVIHPWSTLYMHSSPEEAADAGVYDDTIRVSVGIEDPADLADDFAQAIKAE